MIPKEVASPTRLCLQSLHTSIDSYLVTGQELRHAHDVERETILSRHPVISVEPSGRSYHKSEVDEAMVRHRGWLFDILQKEAGKAPFRVVA